MRVQALVAQRSVEGLDEAVVGRFTQPGEVDSHLVMVRPQIHQPAAEFAAIVGEPDSERRALRA